MQHDLQKMIKKWRELILGVFEYRDTPPDRLLTNVMLIMLYLFGAVLWLRFLNYGDFPSDRLDWNDITYPRLEFVQQAIMEGKLPLHTAQADGMKEVSDRYLSVPDLILTPDILFLRFLPVRLFVVIHLLLLYSIGFWGLLRIRKRFKLSLTAFVPLFFLYNFNGFIVSHLAVGHLSFTAYFLLVFFVELCFDALETEKLNRIWVQKVTIFQLALFLAGGYHFFIWILFFLAVFLLTIPKNKKYIISGIVFSILVNSFRILPAALLSNRLVLDFHTSFGTSDQLLRALTSLVRPIEMVIAKDVIDVRVWEIDYFIGLFGFIFIFIFGWLAFRDKSFVRIHAFLWPSLLLVLFSLGSFYLPLFNSGLPIVSAERVVSRFLILPLVILIFLAVVQFQTFLGVIRNSQFRSLLWIMILIQISDLTQHLSWWEPIQIAQIVAPEQVTVSLTVLNHRDVPYFYLLMIGGAISISALLYLFLSPKKLQPRND